MKNRDALNNKIDECTAVGDKSEDRFDALMKRNGYVVHTSTSDQNIHSHIDRFVNIDNVDEFVGIDVKARKLYSDGNGNEDMCNLVEMMNVRGNEGWLYAKHMKYLAFEYDDHFKIVDREKLIDLLLPLIYPNGNYVMGDGDFSNLKPYQIHRRTGRLDYTTKVYHTDLDKCIYIKQMK